MCKPDEDRGEDLGFNQLVERFAHQSQATELLGAMPLALWDV